MAGGGSFISFRRCCRWELAPIQANATNTVALWPGQLTSVAALRGDLRRDLTARGLCGIGDWRSQWCSRVVEDGAGYVFGCWLLRFYSGVSGPVSRWLRARSAEPHIERAPAIAPLFLVLLPVCFLYRLLRCGRWLFDYERTGSVRRGRDEYTELAEGAGGLPVELLRCADVCVQRCGDLALLPDLDGVCRSGRICGSTVCTAHERRGTANDRRGYGNYGGCLFLLEAAMIVTNPYLLFWSRQ